MRAAGLAGGWLYAAAIVWLSLTPSPPDPGFQFGDKLGHFGAYALLMLWFCALYKVMLVRLTYAALWFALGIGIEFAQTTTAARQFEVGDVLANGLGVIIGLIVATLVGAKKKKDYPARLPRIP